ncbi:MAG: tripartite tricarboxylate transporter permease [Candidatus Aenigmatarchaeota archaeon]
MIFETLIFCLIGIAFGIFCGLVPGFHVNLIVPIILSFSFLVHNPYFLAVLIVSTSISEIFMNFIPSIFLGAPDEDTSLSVLPGHRLLLEGRGYEAIKLTVLGGILSLILSLAFILAFGNAFVYLYEISRPYVHYLIAFVVILMVGSEKKLKKIFYAILIIFLSGFLGIITLNSSLVSQQNVLFPILTGLFGLSTLILSLTERAFIPKQEEDSKLKIGNFQIIKSVILGCFAGIIVGLLPAIGVSQAATLVQYLGKASDARSFLITVSGINVGNEIFSLVNLFLVGNPRSGSSVAVQRVLTELNFYDIVYLIGSVCFSAGIASALTLFLGKKIPKFLEKLNYRKLCIFILIFISTIIFLITGIFGLLIAFVSTSIGLLCALLEIKRSHCMGCLLIPSILYFSGLNCAVLSFLGI